METTATAYFFNEEVKQADIHNSTPDEVLAIQWIDVTPSLLENVVDIEEPEKHKILAGAHKKSANGKNPYQAVIDNVEQGDGKSLSKLFAMHQVLLRDAVRRLLGTDNFIELYNSLK
jgi:hypothetical protein